MEKSCVKFYSLHAKQENNNYKFSYSVKEHTDANKSNNVWVASVGVYGVRIYPNEITIYKIGVNFIVLYAVQNSNLPDGDIMRIMKDTLCSRENITNYSES